MRSTLVFGYPRRFDDRPPAFEFMRNDLAGFLRRACQNVGAERLDRLPCLRFGCDFGKPLASAARFGLIGFVRFPQGTFPALGAVAAASGAIFMFG